MSADDFWKRKSYSTAANALEDHAEPIESAKQALKLKGIGKGCAALVRCMMSMCFPKQPRSWQAAVSR